MIIIVKIIFLTLFNDIIQELYVTYVQRPRYFAEKAARACGIISPFTSLTDWNDSKLNGDRSYGKNFKAKFNNFNASVSTNYN